MRALFAVGEEVICMEQGMPENGVITQIDWFNHTISTPSDSGVPYKGWLYAIDGSESVPTKEPHQVGEWARETHLRKRPPLAKWEDCEFNPTNIPEYT